MMPASLTLVTIASRLSVSVMMSSLPTRDFRSSLVGDLNFEIRQPSPLRSMTTISGTEHYNAMSNYLPRFDVLFRIRTAICASASVQIDHLRFRPPDALSRRSALDEGEEVSVHLFLPRGAHAVRRALVDLQRRALHQLRRQHGRGADRYDLIVVAMQDQGRLVDLLEVLGLVGFRKRLDAEIAGGHAGHHALQPEGFAHALRSLSVRPVVAVERHGQVLEELRAVAQHTLADAVEDLDRQAAGIGCRLS